MLICPINAPFHMEFHNFLSVCESEFMSKMYGNLENHILKLNHLIVLKAFRSAVEIS